MYTPRLVTLPPGAVRLHDARLGERVDLELQAFAIADAPVTQAEYAAVLGRHAAVRADAIPKTPGPHRCEPAGAALPDTPVHGVTWFDAIGWCNAASDQAGLRRAYRVDGSFVDWAVDADGYRLPTEAEWEYACRAGTDGPTYGPLGEIAWTEADDVDEPQPVRGKAPNGLGLFDTLGNVWEWCWDFADPARYRDYRVLRGGGYSDRQWSVRASADCSPWDGRRTANSSNAEGETEACVRLRREPRAGPAQWGGRHNPKETTSSHHPRRRDCGKMAEKPKGDR